MTECVDRRQTDASVREDGVAFAATVGNVVRTLRIEQGWALKGFAECIGLSASILCRTELGARPIDMERLFVLASGLEVSPDELIRRAVSDVCPFGWPSHDALD